MKWEDLGLDDPVPGDVAAFERAARWWRESRAKADLLNNEFSQVIKGESIFGLKGDAREALSLLLEDTHKALRDVPAVCEQFESVLVRHLERLRDIKSASELALSRASLAAEARKVAESEHVASKARVESLYNQLLSLRNQPQDQQGFRLVTLQRELQTARTAEKEKGLQVVDATREVFRQEAERLNLWLQHSALAKSTAGALGQIRLRSLRDPTLVDKFCTAVGHWFRDLGVKFVESGAKTLEALFRGDFEQAAWHLRDFLEAAGTIVAIVGIIAAMILAPGAGFVIALAWIGLAIAATKLAVTVCLRLSDSTNKETGKKISNFDLAFDSLDVVLAAVGVANAGKAGGKGASKIVSSAADGKVSWVAKVNSSRFGKAVEAASESKLAEAGKDAVITVFKEPAKQRLEQIQHGELPKTRSEILDQEIKALRTRTVAGVSCQGLHPALFPPRAATLNDLPPGVQADVRERWVRAR